MQWPTEMKRLGTLQFSFLFLNVLFWVSLQVCFFFCFLSHNVLFADRSPLLQKVCFLNQNRMYTTKTMHQQKSINLKFFDPRNTTLY